MIHRPRNAHGVEIASTGGATDHEDRGEAHYRWVRGDRANRDLEDLKSMVASAHRTQDPAKQIEMEYTIRKAQRDVDKIIDEAKLHRQQLVDLAGGDAMARLDTQMEEEVLALKRLVGAPNEQVATDANEPAIKPPVLDNPLKAPPTAVAGNHKSKTEDSGDSKKQLGPSM